MSKKMLNSQVHSMEGKNKLDLIKIIQMIDRNFEKLVCHHGFSFKIFGTIVLCRENKKIKEIFSLYTFSNHIKLGVACCPILALCKRDINERVIIRKLGGFSYYINGLISGTFQ